MDARRAKHSRGFRPAWNSKRELDYEDGDAPTLKNINLRVRAGDGRGDRRNQRSGKDDAGKSAAAILFADDGVGAN